jgi:hypothetical protein
MVSIDLFQIDEIGRGDKPRTTKSRHKDISSLFTRGPRQQESCCRRARIGQGAHPVISQEVILEIGILLLSSNVDRHYTISIFTRFLYVGLF